MKYLIIFTFLISCSSINNPRPKENYVESRWEIIENATLKKWGYKQLISKLGQPHGKYKHPIKTDHIAWIYYQKSTGIQEWAFVLNKQGIIVSVLYKPKDPYRYEFTIDKIITRWKNFNCKHEKKQELRPGLVKVITYLDCDTGNRIVKYNMYKQVTSINVSASKY